MAADPLLEPLTLNTPRSNARLAVTIAYGKDHAMAMDLLQLRKTKATDDKIEINKLLQSAMADQKDAIEKSRDAARKLPKLAVLADRLLSELKEVKDRNYELLAEVKRDRDFQDFHQDTVPLLAQEMTRLEKVFGAVNDDWQPVHGADVIVPNHPQATLEQAAASRQVLDLRKTTTAQIRGWQAKMSAWLDNVPAGDRGALWQTISQQYERLAKHDIEFGIHRQIQGSFLNRMIAPLHERLNYIGTAAARSAGARIKKMDFWMQSRVHQIEDLGRRWQNTEGDAMRAMGVKRLDTFREMIYNASMSYIEKRQDILAGQKDAKVAEDLAVKETLAYLASDPHTKGMMNAKAITALAAHIRQTARNSEFIEKNRKDMGIKILDERPGYSIYREAIGSTPFTIMRGLNADAVRTYKAMQGTWGEDKTAAEVSTAYARDPNALRSDLAKSFAGPVWDKFLGPIIKRTGRSSFNAPENADGTSNFAMRERVMKAYESAGGDVVKFAENLFALEGGSGDLSAFVGETIETLQSFYANLRQVGMETEKDEQMGLPTVRRYMADARKSEEFPAEWLNYMPYDVHALRQMTKSQSYQAAFGRNMKAMYSDLATAQKEQTDLADTFNALRKAHPTLEGKKLEAAMKADATAQGLGWIGLKEANRNRQMLVDVEAKFKAYLEMNKTRPPEINAWQEIVGTLTAGTVSGPATALMDTVAVPEQAFRRFGFDTEAVKYLLGTGKSVAVQAFGSLLQGFGVTLQSESVHNKLLMEVGAYDPDAMISFRDKFKAMMTEHSDANPVMKPLVKASRAVRFALSTGVGRAKDGAEIAFPTFKPHSAFSMSSQILHSAAIVGWWKRYESYVASALKHFTVNPADLTDAGFKFTPKQLGLSEQAYRHVANALAEYGVPSLEELGRDALTRRKSNATAPLMTVDTYRALAAQSQNAITLNSSLTTRAPRLMNELNWANPLLGWAVQKSYDAAAGFREANGVKSLKGFRTGMMAYAAILPIGLAYALMRDWYDEEIIGRKGNMRDLATIKDAPDAFLTLADNLARVGTFGILGEAVNKWMNYDTQKDVSLDNRIFLVSSALSLQKATANWVRQGNADWATVGRPLMQALGGGGYLQYAGMLNNALALDNAEARVSNRISVNNYLRVTGRELNMNVRTMPAVTR